MKLIPRLSGHGRLDQGPRRGAWYAKTPSSLPGTGLIKARIKYGCVGGLDPDDGQLPARSPTRTCQTQGGNHKKGQSRRMSGREGQGQRGRQHHNFQIHLVGLHIFCFTRAFYLPSAIASSRVHPNVACGMPSFLKHGLIPRKPFYLRLLWILIYRLPHIAFIGNCKQFRRKNSLNWPNPSCCAIWALY
jgi:hypothetical protein